MNRRMESLKLMTALQPFTQLGVIRADDAKHIVDEYKNGNTAPIKELTLDPSLPVYMERAINVIKQFV